MNKEQFVELYGERKGSGISEPALARVAYGSPGVEPRKGRNPGYGINKKYEPRRGGIKGCIMS